MPSSVTLPVNCAHCGGSLTLRVDRWPSSLIPAALGVKEVPSRYRVNWQCPLCRVANTTGVLGTLIAVEEAGRPRAHTTLLVPCTKCRQMVALTYRPLTQEVPTMHSWLCPFKTCRTRNTIGVNGAAPTATIPQGHKPRTSDRRGR